MQRKVTFALGELNAVQRLHRVAEWLNGARHTDFTTSNTRKTCVINAVQTSSSLIGIFRVPHIACLIVHAVHACMHACEECKGTCSSSIQSVSEMRVQFLPTFANVIEGSSNST